MCSTLSATGPSPLSPNLGNALIGAAGIGIRVAASALAAAESVARAAAVPGALVVRAGLRTPPGEIARAEVRSLMTSLDAAGRRDIARARTELDLAVDRAIDRLATDSITSPRTSRTIERALDSPELWKLVDRIANSPEVLNAIASASVGLTNVVADEARRRTATADELAERIARRVLGRAPREPQPIVLDSAAGESGPPQP